MRPRVIVLALALAAAAIPTAARADVRHVVARGHTIDAIASRYRVTAASILEANHLSDARRLHPGDVLTIPTKSGDANANANANEASKAKAADARAAKRVAKTARVDKAAARDALRDPRRGETTSYAMKAKTPGVVHVRRMATREEYEVRVGARRGRVSPTALRTLEKMMRSPSGMAHPIEPRLAQLLAVVSNHFGSRKMEVVSGFRPFTPTQHNPHSNHMHGKAIDFRVAGVPNEAIRDFCRTLKNVGCGYYPNSVFVHMDTRDQSAFWIDYSKPGEPPRYNAPDVDADEGASDVSDDGQAMTGPAPDATRRDAPGETPAMVEPAATTRPDADGPEQRD